MAGVEMEREQRLEAVAGASQASLVDLADRVMQAMDVEVVYGPTVGLLMARAEDPGERLVFNFVEVTVTEAEVLAANHRGYALVIGRCPEKALAAAVLDAAVESGHPLTLDILTLLHRAEAALRQEREDRWARVAPTQVQFEDVT